MKFTVGCRASTRRADSDHTVLYSSIFPNGRILVPTFFSSHSFLTKTERRFRGKTFTIILLPSYKY